jgi:hypothetical protein
MICAAASALTGFAYSTPIRTAISVFFGKLMAVYAMGSILHRDLNEASSATPISFSTKLGSADAANPSAAWIDMGVLFIVRMAVLAMSFRSPELPSSSGVLLCRHRLHMCRITASTITAKVINRKREHPDQKLVTEPMAIDDFAFAPHQSVAARIGVCRPNPASGDRIDRNLVLNALWKRVNIELVHLAAPVCQQWCAGVNFFTS